MSRSAILNLRQSPGRLSTLLVVCCTSFLWISIRLPTSGEEGTESGIGATAADRPAEASDEGELAIGGFRKPAGWQVKLFAAEPHVANPVVMHVDNQGRVFVAESFRQDRGVTDNRKHDQEWLLADLAAESVQDRIDYHRRLLGTEVEQYTAHDDRIRMLEDTDGDQQADRATVFADGFNALEDGTGAGVLVRGNQAYYTCIPKLWLLTDVDGDGQAEQRQALHDGYGVRVAFRGHDSHGLIMGPDGRLYFSIGDRGYNIETPDGKLKDTESGAVFRCELDGSHLEVYATGLRNPQELAFDDYGYLFTGDNNSDSGDKARWVNVMEGGDSGWRMMYQYLPDRGPFNREKIWHPYSPETPAYIVPPIANIGDGPSGLTCYPGTGLQGDYANCFFLVDFRGGASNSGIRLIRSQPRGAFWQVERSEQPIWNILATDADFGPDGALWVCDWVNGWIGEGKGRIYRFLDTVAQQEDVVKEVQGLLAAGFDKLDGARLGELLGHADRRIRLEAQWELATRGNLDEFQRQLAQVAGGTLPRLHAVWGLAQAARLQPNLQLKIVDSLHTALTDRDLDVRAAAASAVGDLKLEQFAESIADLILDDEPRVRYAACQAAGKLQLLAALEPVTKLLDENDNRDPGLRHAGIMALRGVGAAELEIIVGLQQHASAAVRLAAVVALRKLASPAVEGFLADADAQVRLEAARAIHDVSELHSVLPRVAGLELPADAEDALSHRWLNANFRLGNATGAAAIANFAADASRSEAMRLEALEMLGTWAEPGKLDRVMNRYQPLEDRDATSARAAVSARIARILDGSDKLLTAAVDTVVELELSETAGALRQLALAGKRDPKLRSNALAGFVRLASADALPLIKQLLTDDQAAVRSRALAELAELDGPAAVPALAVAIESDTPRERQQAWDTLAKIETPAATRLIEAGLQAYLKGDQPADVWLNVIEASEGRVSRESIKALGEFEQRLASLDPLDTYRDCAVGGDAAKGEELFFNKTELSCVRCHKVGERGGEVGPALTEIGKTKDARYLLQSIVDPDAAIAENFGTVVLLTEDGQVISGILRNENAQRIELIDAEGKLIEVPPVEVVARKQGKSAMPVDLLKNMTRRELRDLVAYLASLGKPSQPHAN